MNAFDTFESRLVAQVWRGLFLGVGDSSLQVYGGRRGWRDFAMYASQVARATWVNFSMLASSMQVESQRDDSDRLELAQLDRAVLWLDVQLVEFSEICDFESFATFYLL